MTMRRSVFDDLSEMFRSFDALFSRALRDPLILPAPLHRRRDLPVPIGTALEDEDLPWTGLLVPAVDCKRRGKELVFRAELPGVKPEDLEVVLEADRLVLRGEKKSEREEKETGWLLREVDYGRFERSFRLPEGVAPNDVKATFADGVLEVTVPAASLPPAKKIPVDVKPGEKKAIKAA